MTSSAFLCFHPKFLMAKYGRPIPDDGESVMDLYNIELQLLRENGKGTWFTAPWLYAE